MHERHAGFVLAADDLDALLDQIFVLVTAGFVIQGTVGLGKLLVDFHLVTRLALLGDGIHDELNFLVGDERSLRADQPRRTGRQIKHVALAEQFVRAHRIENRARIHLGRDLKSNTRRDVRLDDAGDDVHARPLRGDDAMYPRRARHLRNARDGHFHVRRRDEH